MLLSVRINGKADSLFIGDIHSSLDSYCLNFKTFVLLAVYWSIWTSFNADIKVQKKNEASTMLNNVFNPFYSLLHNCCSSSASSFAAFFFIRHINFNFILNSKCNFNRNFNFHFSSVCSSIFIARSSSISVQIYWPLKYLTVHMQENMNIEDWQIQIKSNRTLVCMKQIFHTGSSWTDVWFNDSVIFCSIYAT